MSLPVAVLAGGLATRLHPITETIPKSLIEVAGRPFAEHQLDWLRRERITQVVFLVGHLGEQIRAALGDGRKWGMSIEYVFDGDRLLGTGGALRRARPALGPAFFVMYGDSYLDCDLAAVEGAFAASGMPALMTVFRNDDQWDRSNVLFEGGRIVRYDKRDRGGAMKHIDYGLSVLAAEALEPYPADAKFDLATVFQDLLTAGRLAAYEVPRRFYEIGSMSGLEEVRTLLEKGSDASRQRGTRE